MSVKFVMVRSFDPDQHVFSGVGDIGPSFKGGSLRLMGNVTNLMGLYEKAHREKPELASEIYNLNEYFYCYT